MRVAVTGTGGRLGRAVLAALADAPFTGLSGPMSWGRPDYDLDDEAAARRLVDRDRPEVIVHTAAWTDVDGCAREPDVANRRNGQAVGWLARAAAGRGIDLVLVSTNEVFDGRRTDGLGYGPADRPNPINAYGASKLAGEEAAAAAFEGTAQAHLAIVRTAWLYGPPGNDFPMKIARAAADAIGADRPLRVVADETGSPTYTADVADAIVELIGSDGPVEGVHHAVNAGMATRVAWARAVLAGLHLDPSIEEVPAATWTRASTPPAWAVLAPTPMPSGEPLRGWPAALADYLPVLARQIAASDPARSAVR